MYWLHTDGLGILLMAQNLCMGNIALIDEFAESSSTSERKDRKQQEHWLVFSQTLL